MDFDERLVVFTADKQNWVQDPPDPLRRVRLESNTVKRADGTSIVHYPAGSGFPAHGHPGGEEILVLEGTFQDEHGDYPCQPFSVAGKQKGKDDPRHLWPDVYRIEAVYNDMIAKARDEDLQNSIRECYK